MLDTNERTFHLRFPFKVEFSVRLDTELPDPDPDSEITTGVVITRFECPHHNDRMLVAIHLAAVIHPRLTSCYVGCHPNRLDVDSPFGDNE